MRSYAQVLTAKHPEAVTHKPHLEYNEMGARITTKRGIANAKLVTSSEVGFDIRAALIEKQNPIVENV